MPNIELLENSMLVAPIESPRLAGCRELAEEVDKKLVKFSKELVAAKKSTIIPQGYAEKSFLVDCECPRFGTGEGKGYIKESVRGTDLYIMVDVTNYSLTYSVCGHENHMSPDDHYQDLKRIISAATGKAHPYQRYHAISLLGTSAQTYQENLLTVHCTSRVKLLPAFQHPARRRSRPTCTELYPLKGFLITFSQHTSS